MVLLRSHGAGDASLGFYNNLAPRSAKFRQADSSYLYKTDYSSDGDLRQMTFSFWIKRSQSVMGAYNIGEIISQGYAGGGGTQSSARITIESDKLNIAQEDSNATTWERISTALFRDSLAWYHFVVALDVTEASSSNRVKAWVNGVAITWGTETSSKPDQNTDMRFGKIHMRIGVSDSNGSPWSSSYFDGYMSDFHYCDGEVKAATDFGEFKNGAWIPKAYTGSYGTNGFRLEFKQTGTGTAGDSTIGADTANNNDWTTSGFATTDSNLPDCPENNWCTLNELYTPDNDTYSEGNLAFTAVHGKLSTASFAMPSGKWYCEVRSVHSGNTNTYIGVFPSEKGFVANPWNFTRSINQDGGGYATDSSYSDAATYGTWATGTVLGMTYDSSNGQMKMYKDDGSGGATLLGTITESAFVGKDIYFAVSTAIATGGASGVWNFGQDGTFAGNETAQGNSDANGHGNFFMSVPAGFLALCANNLEEPTIGPNSDTQADDHFKPTLYTSDDIGDGETQNVTNVGFKPDLVWLKNRDATSTAHTLFDSANTYGGNSYHWSTNSNANRVGANSEYGYLSVFRDDGFTLAGGSTSGNYVNQDTDKYVAYNWKAGGPTSADNSASAGATPTSGSVKIDGSNFGSALAGDIPATRLTANTTAGFSIITYAGNQTDDETIAHGLGAVPEVLIVKNMTGGSGNYPSMYHVVTGSGKELYLTLTQAASSSNFWRATPTSTVFSVSASDYVNYTGYTYVAYAFAPVAGFSKFGKYIGNGSPTDGVFVHTGFRPSWIMTRSEAAGGWYINDSARSPGNSTNLFGGNLYAESDGVESGNGMDMLSNGFKIRNNDASQNTSTQSYVYMAFAEMPFKYANAR